MPAPKYPPKAKGVYTVKKESWNLVSGGLYSFKVVLADPNTGRIDITKEHSEFTEFVLPVNPQGLQVSIPFATNVSATSGGIVEENGGVVFRNISINGTFGVSARRVQATTDAFTTSLSSTDLRSEAPQVDIFRGVSGAALNASALLVNTIGAAAATVRQASQFSRKPTPLVSGIKSSDLDELGHAKISDLVNYLVAYAELKRTLPGKHARLIFVNRKDGVNYAVTPQTLDTTKDANDPHLTRYRIALRAWDIADGSVPQILPGFSLTPTTPQLVAALDKLRTARSVVASLQDVLRGVLADVDNIIGTVNLCGIILKDLTATAYTFAEFDDLLALKGNELTDVLNALGAPIETIVADVTNPSRLPSGTRTAQKHIDQQSRDFQNPLRTSQQRLSLLSFTDRILPDSISLSAAEQNLINDAIANAQRTTVADLDAKRTVIEDARNTLLDAIGLSDPDVDAVFGRTPTPQVRDPQSADYKVLQALSDVLSTIDVLTATRDVVGTRVPDPFIRARTNANNPEVEIQSSTTGYPVPFPLGATLESLAARYLGNPDRWLDIAVANGLQPPYIDEDGYELPFVSNGDEDTLLVADASALHLNQEVFVSARNMPSSRRHVLSVRKLPSTNWEVRLDGDLDLENYLAAKGAKLKAFASSTVNSSKMIVIPTPGVEPGDSVPNTKIIPLTATLDRQQRSMGVDLAISDDFDLVLTPTGDFKLVAGTANAFQAIRTKLSTEKGSVPKHPEVGIGLQVGTRLRTTDGVRAMIENAILGDDRFTSIQALVVRFEGSTLRLDLTVKVAGGGSTIPLSFTISG